MALLEWTLGFIFLGMIIIAVTGIMEDRRKVKGGCICPHGTFIWYKKSNCIYHNNLKEK